MWDERTLQLPHLAWAVESAGTEYGQGFWSCLKSLFPAVDQIFGITELPADRRQAADRRSVANNESLVTNMSIGKAFKLLIKTAAWATPHIQRWHRKRTLNRSEALRHLGAKNWSLAEEHFTLALEERKHSTKQHVELLSGLAQAQLPQGKTAEAKQTLESAIEIASTAKNSAAQLVVLDTLVDIQLATADNSGAEKTAIEIDRLERKQAPPNLKRIAVAARKLG